MNSEGLPALLRMDINWDVWITVGDAGGGGELLGKPDEIPRGNLAMD